MHCCRILLGGVPVSRLAACACDAFDHITDNIAGVLHIACRKADLVAGHLAVADGGAFQRAGEHLVFLLGNHTAIFLVSILSQLGGLVLPAVVGGPLTFIGFLYMVSYCWRGMRVFYGNGRGLTAVKFLVLGLLYIWLAAIVLTTTGLVSLLEV